VGGLLVETGYSNYYTKTNSPSGKSSMFPMSWSKSVVESNIKQAFSNKTVKGNYWTGYTNNGMLIKGYIGKDGVTAYPVYRPNL